MIQAQWLGTCAYKPLWQKMRQYAANIAAGNAEEKLLLCEHDPVYVTGRRGVINTVNKKLPAPFIVSDRGGETTYHGYGQIMLYPIINVRKRLIPVKRYVWLLEESCIKLLQQLNVNAHRKCGMPGVWVADAKIAALGVRITKGIALHGMALNIHTNLKYFSYINPCGLGKAMCRLQDINPYIMPDLTTEMQKILIAEQWGEVFLELLESE
ncbi:MAG: lipoyl(octanoyl) transferase LipB [Mariprofundales bacterium]